MRTRSTNKQMFALGEPPPETIELAGRRYRLVRVFKHDFWAATCLYSPQAPGTKVVAKFGRSQDFCGLPMNWVGRLLSRREEAVYKALESIDGVPRWMGRIGDIGYAVEYVHARPLDHLAAPPDGFFDRLRELFDAVHARGVAYCDANKRSNILIGPSGKPFLIDYQISIRRRDDLPLPIRSIVRRFVDYMCRKDLYHLYKHKRRLRPDELTEVEDALSRERTSLHLVHRKLTKPYRTVRRWFLRRQYQKGRLLSPTADLEDHYQPEKAKWRKAKETDP